MTQTQQHTIAELAARCGGRFLGPEQAGAKRIRTVAALNEAGPDDISWVVSPKHAKEVPASGAAAIVGTEALLGSDPRGIVVRDPSAAIADILDLYWIAPSAPAMGVHPTAIVDATASIAKSAAIGAYAVIGPRASVGDDSVIHEGVSIGAEVRIGEACLLHDRVVIYDRCTIGNRVIIHSGTVIGADGFGYIFRDGQHRRVPHIGTVTIEDDVEIGANSCIDRAKVGSTVVGRGSKIDNLVMVAHNVQLGPLCILAAQVGISGSARLGQGVIMGGQVGVADGVVIGSGAMIAAQSGIEGAVPPGVTMFGYPAKERSEAFRIEARIRKLPRLYDEVAELARRIEKLEAATHHSEHG